MQIFSSASPKPPALFSNWKNPCATRSADTANSAGCSRQIIRWISRAVETNRWTNFNASVKSSTEIWLASKKSATAGIQVCSDQDGGRIAVGLGGVAPDSGAFQPTRHFRASSRRVPGWPGRWAGDLCDWTSRRRAARQSYCRRFCPREQFASDRLGKSGRRTSIRAAMDRGRISRAKKRNQSGMETGFKGNWPPPLQPADGSGDRDARLKEKNEYFRHSQLQRLQSAHEEKMSRLRQETTDQARQLSEGRDARLAKLENDFQSGWQTVVSEWQSQVLPLWAAIQSASATANKLFPDWLAADWERPDAAAKIFERGQVCAAGSDHGQVHFQPAEGQAAGIAIAAGIFGAAAADASATRIVAVRNRQGRRRRSNRHDQQHHSSPARHHAAGSAGVHDF